MFLFKPYWEKQCHKISINEMKLCTSNSPPLLLSFVPWVPMLWEDKQVLQGHCRNTAGMSVGQQWVTKHVILSSSAAWNKKYLSPLTSCPVCGVPQNFTGFSLGMFSFRNSHSSRTNSLFILLERRVVAVLLGQPISNPDLVTFCVFMKHSHL